MLPCPWYVGADEVGAGVGLAVFGLSVGAKVSSFAVGAREDGDDDGCELTGAAVGLGVVSVAAGDVVGSQVWPVAVGPVDAGEAVGATVKFPPMSP